MNLLALDTSTDACTSALSWQGQVLSRHRISPRRHADTILDDIRDLLAEVGASPTQLDGIAVGKGPGSFTGVRIAAGVAQGLAFAADLPVAPVSSLRIMAAGLAGASQGRPVAVAVDARLGEVYCGFYRATPADPASILAPDRLMKPNDVQPPETADAWFGAGSGFTVFGEELARSCPCAQVQTLCYPNALDLVALGELVLRGGQGVAAADAVPAYLREKVALTAAERHS